MTDLKALIAEIEQKPYVYSATIWNDRRIYVNLAGKDASFAGDRNLKAFYDPQLGWVYEGFKGAMTSAFCDSFENWKSDYAPSRR